MSLGSLGIWVAFVGCAPEVPETAETSAPEYDPYTDWGCQEVYGGAWYPDSDGDGFGDPDGETIWADYTASPEGYTLNRDDCDDGDPAIHPDAPEICDGVDNACRGRVDDHADCPCPQGYFEDRAYLFCDSVGSLEEARSQCSGLGYGLAVANSPEERTWLENAVGVYHGSGEAWWEAGEAEGPRLALCEQR